MKTNVLLLTHNGIGASLVHAAEAMIGPLPLATTALSVDYHIDHEKFAKRLQLWVDQIENDYELLILTDLYGSTPCNIAKHLSHMRSRVRIVSGLNLPMLIRVMNYPQLNLVELAQKALSGGRDGVIPCLVGFDYD